MSADGKAVDRRGPRLLDGGAVHVVRQSVGLRHAAENFVNKAEVAFEEPDKRYLAAIKVREIDAGAEQPAAAILWMFDHTAAQHGDVCCRIENRGVDGDLHGVDSGVVFRVEE